MFYIAQESEERALNIQLYIQIDSKDTKMIVGNFPKAYRLNHKETRMKST